MVPKFYGSFTLEVPTEYGRSRSVRLILIQFIDALPMIQLNPKDFSIEDRKHIIKRVIDAESATFARSIRHGDIHVRNFLVRDAPNNPPVVLVDFGLAEFSRPRPSQYPVWWHSQRTIHRLFEELIDWDWLSWLKETYEETATMMTQGRP